MLKWRDRDERGEVVDFPEAGFGWHELGRLARKHYADQRDPDWAELLERLRAVRGRLVATIAARPDDERYGCAWYGNWTRGRMIQLDTASPRHRVPLCERAQANPPLAEGGA